MAASLAGPSGQPRVPHDSLFMAQVGVDVSCLSTTKYLCFCVHHPLAMLQGSPRPRPTSHAGRFHVVRQLQLLWWATSCVCWPAAPTQALFRAHVQIAPTGMVFIPCRNGWSHRPDEYASPGDIARGIEVLALALAQLAGGSSGGGSRGGGGGGARTEL